jgi:hypothetical protein
VGDTLMMMSSACPFYTFSSPQEISVRFCDVQEQ